MPLRQKAAGLLVVRLGSNMLPPRSAAAYEADVSELLDRFPALGGLLVVVGALLGPRLSPREIDAGLDTVAERSTR